MSENTTRIEDLPDSTSTQMPPNMGGIASPPPPISNTRTNYDMQNPTYKPINVHPNPYGNMLQPEVMPHPQSKPTQDQIPPEVMEQMLNHPNIRMVHGEVGPEGFDPQLAELKQMPPYRLPSRDIPMDQEQYFRDEEIRPNYIPKPKLTSDYVKEYEEAAEKFSKKQESNKKNAEKIDDAMTDFQLPLIVIFLFFIFQLPFLHNMMYKYLSIFPIFHADGNLNFYGILFKSSLFGMSFWGLQQLIMLIS